MKFPVQEGSSTENLEVSHGVCPICKKSGVGEPDSFAYVNAGALLAISKNSAAPDERIQAFFNIGFHAAHSGNGQSASLNIVENPSIGQFEFYFCSTTCVLSFMPVLMNLNKNCKETPNPSFQPTAQSCALGSLRAARSGGG